MVYYIIVTFLGKELLKKCNLICTGELIFRIRNSLLRMGKKFFIFDCEFLNLYFDLLKS